MRQEGNEMALKSFEIHVTGHLRVTAIVMAETVARATEIAWNAEMLPGESVEYQQQMECFDWDGPTVETVGEIEADNFNHQSQS